MKFINRPYAFEKNYVILILKCRLFIDMHLRKVKTGTVPGTRNIIIKKIGTVCSSHDFVLLL
jgi:hypothetical protein